MSDNIHLDRVRNKFLAHFVNTSLLYNVVESFVIDGEQEDLKKMVKAIEAFETEYKALKNSIQTLLQHMGNVNTDEVDAIETEEGYEL